MMKLRKALLLKLLPILLVQFTGLGQRDSRVFAQSAVTSMARYFDPSNGMTADQAVAYALRNNGELLAVRSEIEAARARIRQAGLRPNPAVEFERKNQLGGSDNTTMVAGTWPLELGGRRSARVLVAQKETELREQLLADRERLLAAEVRKKFGVALAEILKLGFTEDLVTTTDRGFNIVAAKVKEGRTAPLEENILLVEVNRIRSVRETNEGKVEVALLELRNIIGMKPDEPLRLKGDFDHPTEALPTLTVVTEEAIRTRPDILAAHASEELASARIEQARAEGRLNASLIGRYERMDSSFPQQGLNMSGQMVPIQGVFHSIAGGITLELPVRNKNQGEIASAVAENEAAKRRREFTELTVRNEVAMAFARYQRAARAAEIYRVGVKEQASNNLNVIRQTYELGSKTLLDYVAEQRRFIELENGYIDALLETYLARVEVQRAMFEPKLIALSEKFAGPTRLNNSEVK